MKKYIYIIAAVLTLAACGKSQEEIETEKFEKEQQRKIEELEQNRKDNLQIYKDALKNETDPDSVVYKTPN